MIPTSRIRIRELLGVLALVLVWGRAAQPDMKHPLQPGQTQDTTRPPPPPPPQTPTPPPSQSKQQVDEKQLQEASKLPASIGSASSVTDKAAPSGTGAQKTPVPTPTVRLLASQRPVTVRDLQNPSLLTESIALAANYIQNNCGQDGRFVYEQSADQAHASRVQTSDQYNWVRHAGTIYALGQVQESFGPQSHTDFISTALRAINYMRNNAFAPVTEADQLKMQRDRASSTQTQSSAKEVLAVWSKPAVTKNVRRPMVKLGSVGLTLAALLQVERVKPGTTSVNTLQQLGNFLLLMQGKDGEFASKWPYDSSFQSLYYPGEAVLALVMLYEHDHQPQWLVAAAKGLAFLCQSRRGRPDVPVDHWSLIATAELLPHLGKDDHLPHNLVTKKALIQHAEQICSAIVAGIPQSQDEATAGALTPEFETTRTAIRLEGMLAIQSSLQDDDLRQKVSQAIEQGMTFILRSQIRTAPSKGDKALGAVPRGMPCDEGHLQNCVVRVDYVQHALSAMLAYMKAPK